MGARGDREREHARRELDAADAEHERAEAHNPNEWIHRKAEEMHRDASTMHARAADMFDAHDDPDVPEHDAAAIADEVIHATRAVVHQRVN